MLDREETKGERKSVGKGEKEKYCLAHQAVVPVDTDRSFRSPLHRLDGVAEFNDSEMASRRKSVQKHSTQKTVYAETNQLELIYRILGRVSGAL